MNTTFRQLIWPLCLAAVCAAVLGTRVYTNPDRVRVRLVTTPRPADSQALAVPLREQQRLAGLPTAIILRVHAQEATDFSIALDGMPIGTTAVPANREIRIDMAAEVFPASAREFTITGSRPGWSLMYLETATVHGYAGPPLNVIVAPHARRGDGAPMRVLLPLFIALLVWRPRSDWPAGRVRYLHRALAGFVLILFAVALIAPFVSRYSILLSMQTFVLGVAALYAQSLARAWSAFRRWRASDPPSADDVHAAPEIPRWVTVLDVLCLITLGLIVRSMIEDDYRISLTPDIHISLRSWGAIGLWLAGLLVLRHAAWRVVPWHTRVAGWIRSLVRHEPLREVWTSYLVSRILVLIVGYVAVAAIGFNPPPAWRGLSSDVLDLYARWDGGWYFGIASKGYEDGPGFNPGMHSALAFFPGLPLLMRVTGVLLDVNLWVAGIIVVVIAFLWALTYVYRLARLDLSLDQARASVMFLAFYPFAVCYSAILTESLFLLAAAAAFFHFRHDHLWKAAFFALFAGLLRPNGFLLAAPLGLLAVLPFARSRGWLAGAPSVFSAEAASTSWRRLATQLAIAAVPVIGMLSYAWYVHSLTGDPFAFVKAQQAWGRTSAGIFDVIDTRWSLIESEGWPAYAVRYPIEIFETIAALFALGAVWPITRRFGLAYGAFVALAVLPPFVTMGSVSLGRYTAPLFPLFLWLGASITAERRPYWIAAFAALQALFAALFFTWRPPY